MPSLGRKKKKAFCKIRLPIERCLWSIVLFLGILLGVVNIYLLRQWGHRPKSEQRTKHPIWTTSTIQSSHEKRHDSDRIESKGPLLQLLIDAGMTHEYAHSVASQLPTWQQVIARFGREPRIIGLDTCEAYNRAIPRGRRMLAAAGTFNTGTNLLAQLLQHNCIIDDRKESMQWQVNWGKHQSPKFRLNHSVHSNLVNAEMMPVVMVRDPYNWMQSMCKTRYSAHWFHVVPDHCPNFIPNEVERDWYDTPAYFVRKHYKNDPWKVDNVLDKAGFSLHATVIPVRVRYKATNVYHKSLVHMWKDWNQDYYEATFPRLMIRLEDLVYHPRVVLEEVCHCVEGTLSPNLTLPEESAIKGGDNIHGTNRTSLVQAMYKHVHANQTRGMTYEDIQFARKQLDDSVMTIFGYVHPS